jgi:large subunit ribosomal protein L18e
MARAYAKSNDELIGVLAGLRKAAKKESAPLWQDIADRLEKPSRSWAEVNLSRISRVAPKGSTIVVPGKVLGSGSLPHAVTVAAYSFSGSARTKIKAAGGEALSIPQLMAKVPGGSNVKVVS